MTTPAIQVDHLHVAFDGKPVVDDLSFEIAPGETFGLLGANGAGKTTTIRALLGIIPAQGTLLVRGTPFSPTTHRGVGYLPEERGLYRRESVIEVMTYLGQLKGMARAEANLWATYYLERVGLAGRAKTRVHRLSGGEQQKVQLGVTIMDNPDILILDEPTKGFDPVNRRLLLELVEDRRRGGATVVIITHQMDEVERLCDRVLLLKDGRAEAYGTVADVQRQFGTDTIRLRYSGTLPDSDAWTVALSDPNYAELVPAAGVDVRRVLAELAASDLDVLSLESGRASMEDVFLRVYGARAEEVAL